MRNNERPEEQLQETLGQSGRPLTGCEAVAAARSNAQNASHTQPGGHRPSAEGSRDFVFITDEHGRVQFVNGAAARELGVREGEVVGRRLEELFAGGGLARQGLTIADVVRSGKAVSFEGKAALLGRDVWLTTTVEPILGERGEVTATLGISREIAPRKGAEDPCHITRAELSAAFRDAPTLMLLIDLDGRVQQVNRAAVRFARRRSKSMVGGVPGTALRCLHAPGDPKQPGPHGLFCRTCPLRLAVERTLNTGTSQHRVESVLPLARRDMEGDTHFLTSTIPLRAAGRRMVLLCLEDITERKRAEQALRESKRTLATLMSNLPGMAYRCRNDEHWTMEFVSEGCFELTGYQPHDLRLNHTASYEELIHPEDRGAVRRDVEAAIERGRPFELVYRIITAGGEEKWVWEKGSGVFSPQGQLVALEGLITDITARKRAEEEKERMQALLLHAQKMEAIGVLAGGVAHDFNNLLTIVHGNAELALMAAEQGDPSCTDLLHKVLSAAEHGASLVRRLLVFSRKQPVELMALSVNRVVGDLLKMLGRLIGEDIEIHTTLRPDLWTVRADEANAEQVIMNLAVNARDAMPDGGKLTLATDNVALDQAVRAAMPQARPGRFVCLTVTDTGVGMDAQTVQRIFEPFFSTKEPGRGTGLGLSVVYGVVHQHGGWITVSSAPGHGSTFKVYLPASSPDPQEEPHDTPPLDEVQGHGERLLLVEDERALREMARTALASNGYQVMVAANAEEAEAIFAKEEGHLDLVLSDVVLPGKSGIQLADRLLALKPGLRVLLSSGHADRKSQWPVICERGFPFLPKPYSLVALLRAARQALGPQK